MRLGYDEISEILKIIDSSSCEEFVLETGDIKLILRRRSANGSTPPSSAEAPTAPAAAPPGPVGAKQRRSEPTASYEGMEVVRAPMVGTFYRSPSPDAPPFVEVGSQVKKGDPLCLIEVMKLFTTIAAERDGIVTEIGPANAAAVEYGQMLFVIRPT